MGVVPVECKLKVEELSWVKRVQVVTLRNLPRTRSSSSMMPCSARACFDWWKGGIILGSTSRAVVHPDLWLHRRLIKQKTLLIGRPTEQLTAVDAQSRNSSSRPVKYQHSSFVLNTTVRKSTLAPRTITIIAAATTATTSTQQSKLSLIVQFPLPWPP